MLLVGRHRAGFAVTLPGPAGTAVLDGLFVEPPLWGAGLGRRLVADAVRLARGQGARRLTVIANPAALGFYARLGFRRGAACRTRFGRAVAMWRAVEGPAGRF